jgi:hypothetical protein
MQFRKSWLLFLVGCRAWKKALLKKTALPPFQTSLLILSHSAL